MAKVSDNIKRAFNIAEEKTSKAINESQVKLKLKVEITEKEIELEKKYIKLGKKYFEEHKDDDDVLVKKVATLEAEIQERKDRLEEMK